MAICINCGTTKKRPIDRCHVCHLKPQSAEEKAKSIILSTHYEIDGEYRGQSKESLLALVPVVAAHKYTFDPAEVASVIAYAEEVTSIPHRKLGLDFLRWFGLPVLILVIVLIVLWLTK